MNDACYDDTRDCCNDTGGWCDDNVACIDFDTYPCEVIPTYMETTFSDNVDVCIDEPYETYDEGYCYEETYQPMYCNSPRNNSEGTDSSDQYLIWFLWICTFILIFCKFEYQCIYVMKFF